MSPAGIHGAARWAQIGWAEVPGGTSRTTVGSQRLGGREQVPSSEHLQSRGLDGLAVVLPKRAVITGRAHAKTCLEGAICSLCLF